MSKTIYVNGIEIDLPKLFCTVCGCNESNFKYSESNKTIQMRCSACGKWHGNYKMQFVFTKVYPSEIRQSLHNFDEARAAIESYMRG